MITRGPSIYSVPGVSGVSIPAAGGVLGPITFVWPRALFVTSLLVATRGATRQELAALSLSILDETQQEIFFNGKGGAYADRSSSCMSLVGTLVLPPQFDALVLLRPFKLQRPVAAGDNWLFTLTNSHPTDVIIPELTISFEEGAAK